MQLYSVSEPDRIETSAETIILVVVYVVSGSVGTFIDVATDTGNSETRARNVREKEKRHHNIT